MLIIGAGVAGLSCAVALRRNGLTDLTIVERGSEVASQRGTGIAIPPNGARALVAVGLPIDRLIRSGSHLRHYRVLDGTGRELSRADLTRLWLSQAEPYFAVHRQRIYEALLEVLGDQKIEFKSTAALESDVLDRGQPVSVRIDGPIGSRAETFDLVVGADGIRSALRQSLWPTVAPRSLGWWTWRCVLQYDAAEPETQVVSTGLGGVFMYLTLGGGQVYAYAAVRQTGDSRGRKDTGHGHFIADRFGAFGLPGPLLDALARLPDQTFHVGELEEVPYEQLQGAGRGRAVLVGDALHACSPNMAQGVSLAAEDAAVLAEVIRNAGESSIPEPFWRRRLPRIRHVQEYTRKRDHMINKRADSALFRQASNLVIRWRGFDRMQRDAFSYLLDNRA